MPPALLALTLAVFSIGTTEFAVMGLLPEIATDLHVTVPVAGLLVSGYAAGVAIGGPILAIVTNGVPRKTALLVLLAIFVVGHVLTASAPSYGIMMLGRIVTSFCHGAFVGIASVVAVGVVRSDQQAMAIAVVWAGFSASSIIGVPAGTALGHALGWRSTFWAIALLATVAALLIAILLPAQREEAKSHLLAEFGVLLRPSVILALLLSALFTAAGFGVYTYIVPMLTGVTGFAPDAIPWVLLMFGIGGTVGIFAGARLADWKLDPVIIGIVASAALVYAALLLTIHSPALAAVTVFVWGALFYAPASAIQLRIVRKAQEAPNLASTLNQSAFNIGNVIGPAMGAGALTAGLSYALVPLIGVVLAGLGLIVATTSYAMERTKLAPTAE